MKTIVTFGALAAAALALAACSGNTATPKAEETTAAAADTTEAMPAEGEGMTAEDAAALDAATNAAEGTDQNSNPIGPNAAAPASGAPTE
ncbi:MAG: hypothetical protein GC147_03345 [Porphyrobacter sp.]|nr:hypothetical protein [Porphyrobacter sp.]